MTQDVVVLAKSFGLSESQKALLSRGLSFIPTLDIGRNQKIQLQWDIQNYHRKLKLAAYFKDTTGKGILPFVAPSTWTPPSTDLPPELLALIEEDLAAFKKHYRLITERCNIPQREVEALRELQHAKHMVIKPADKGSAVVILSREQYVLEVERQLNDAVYYRKLKEPIYMETIPMVISIADSLKKKKFINGKQRQYLIGNSQPRERRFYILPKIHKEPQKWTIPFEIPPGRPIVSDCGSETYHTAEFLDYYLNPLSTKHPAYVRDTYHFIEFVKNLTIRGDFYFFSMDVDNLYTNIPIPAGIECVRNIFRTYPDPKRPDDELLKLLELNLTRNDFMFNDKFYLQIKGTAMGKKFAPAYANIFMANWEKEALAKCQQQPACYLRYLDDVWGIWTGTEEQFEQFVAILNSHDPSIHLKTELNKESIDFLDTTVFKGPNFKTDFKLDIKVFFKVTDTHALLHKQSFHPKHTFRGIVKSQILRFKRICTQDEHFNNAVSILFKALRKRGYSRHFLRQCLKKFQEKKARNHGDSIPLILTYSSVSKFLNNKLKTNFEKLLAKQNVVRASGVVSAYRRCSNLQDLLVRARLPSLKTDGRLLLDKQFVRLTFVKNIKDNVVHKIDQGFSPRSTNCVYVLFCSRCKIKYVGETKNTLSLRMTQHRYNIKNKKELDTPLVRHFLLHGFDAIRMAGLQKNSLWTDQQRKAMERRWIFLLSTRMPFGLNLRRD